MQRQHILVRIGKSALVVAIDNGYALPTPGNHAELQTTVHMNNRKPGTVGDLILRGGTGMELGRTLIAGKNLLLNLD